MISNDVEYFKLENVLEEYSDKNIDNVYQPVAVGKYGIRSRESIYSKELANDYSKNKLIYKNTLTVGMGSNQIDIGVLTDDCTYSVSPAYHTFKIKNINSKYLQYCLEAFNQEMFELFSKRGARQGKTIDFKRWLKYEIPVYGAKKQADIIKVFEEIEEAQKKVEINISKLDNLIASKYQTIISNWKTSGYQKKKLCDICDIISGGTPSRTEKKYWNDGTIPWIKTTELKNDYINKAEEYITDSGLKNSSAKIIKKGSVLIAMYGQGRTRGMTGMLNIDACTNQACACLTAKSDVDNYFLWQSMILAYEDLRNLAKGGNQLNLNLSMIKNYEIIIPSLDIQKEFVEFTNIVKKAKELLLSIEEKLDAFKKSLMQEYFG